MGAFLPSQDSSPLPLLHCHPLPQSVKAPGHGVCLSFPMPEMLRLGACQRLGAVVKWNMVGVFLSWSVFCELCASAASWAEQEVWGSCPQSIPTPAAGRVTVWRQAKFHKPKGLLPTSSSFWLLNKMYKAGLLCRAWKQAAQAGNSAPWTTGNRNIRVRKCFLTEGVVKHWNGLLRGSGGVSSLEVFRNPADGTLCHVV